MQLQSIVEILQTAIFLVKDSENTLQHPLPYHNCQHGQPAPECTKTPPFLSVCPSSEDIKYRLTRASVDCVDLYLAEAGTALNIQVIGTSRSLAYQKLFLLFSFQAIRL